MKLLDGNNFYNLKTSAKVLAKLTSCFRITFSPRRSKFAYVCLSFELAFESKLIVLMNKIGCKQSKKLKY